MYLRSTATAEATVVAAIVRRYVLCGLYSRGIVQVWSVEDPEWACKIDEGPAGIKHCRCADSCWCSTATAGVTDAADDRTALAGRQGAASGCIWCANIMQTGRLLP